MLPQPLRATTRSRLAGLLAAAALGYAGLVIAAYVQTTAPSALAPDLAEIDRLLFSAARPKSPLEKRVAAADTPLGTGPLISGPSMLGLAFAGQSPDLAKSLTAGELAEREGERQALLDWIRTGASRAAYEQDDYLLSKAAEVTRITPDFVVCDLNGGGAASRPRVHIRSLINERCVACHAADSAEDTAHLIPFDTYDAIARYLQPETHADGARPWLVAALAALFPLAGLVGPLFAVTHARPALRRAMAAITMAALAGLGVSWIAFSALTPVMVASTLLALLAILAQGIAAAAQLLRTAEV